MKVAIIGSGACARLAAGGLRRAGCQPLPLDEAEPGGAAGRAAALGAERPDLLLRVGGRSSEDAAWEALQGLLPEAEALEVLLADPPDPRAAPLLAPLVAGAPTGWLALRRPGGRVRALAVPAGRGERGERLVARAFQLLGELLGERLCALAPGSRLRGALGALLGALPGAAEQPPPLPDEVDWSEPPLRTIRLLRALAPFGGAATRLGREPLRLRSAEMAAWTGAPDAPPGTFVADTAGVRVRCGAGALRILAARAGGRELGRRPFARFCAGVAGVAGDPPLRFGEAPPALLPFGVPELGAEEEQAVLRTLRSRWIGTGPTAAALERDFCAATGAAHAVAVSSCTAALHLALLAAGVGPGDEVITTPLTFVATVNAILYTGARPVLADVEPESLNLDPEAVEAALTPRTRAIVPVHFGGRPCDMARLRALAARRGVALVEDAAHALGARHPGGAAVGSGPEDACFSFYPNKNLTTCEGGMLATRSGERAERYARLRMHGLTADAWKRFGSEEIVRSRMVELGFKYNLTDLQAAIGRAQLPRLEPWTQLRNEQAALYREAFAGLQRVRPLPALPASQGRHAYHLFTVWIEGLPRDQAQLELRGRGIGAAIHYEPIHLHPFHRARLGLPPGSFPVAEDAGDRTLTLPIGPSLRSADLRRVIEAVRALEKVEPLAPRAPRAGSAAARPVSRRAWSPRPTTPPGG